MTHLLCIRTSLARLTIVIALQATLALSVRLMPGAVTTQTNQALVPLTSDPDQKQQDELDFIRNDLDQDMEKLVSHALSLHTALQTANQATWDAATEEQQATAPNVQAAAATMKQQAAVATMKSISHMPAPTLFTFGAMAYTHPDFDLGFALPGARVVVHGDPVPAIAQVAGFHHDGMVAVVQLDARKDDEGNFQLDAVHTLPGKRNGRTVPRSVGVDNQANRHSVPTYVSLLKQRLLQTGQNQKVGQLSTNMALETYRMAVLTNHVSYQDSVEGEDIVSQTGSTQQAREESMQRALDTLNAEKNPLDPATPLFASKIEHVMCVQFFTPASLAAKGLNQFGPRIGLGPHVLDGGNVVHNVHLLKDGGNNGFMTFEGTTNLATMLDLDLDMTHHGNTLKKFPGRFAVRKVLTQLDEEMAMCFQEGSHSGVARTIQAFVKSEHFPKLAAEASKLSSLVVTGHSIGGSLASMWATCEKGAQRFPTGAVFDGSEWRKAE